MEEFWEGRSGGQSISAGKAGEGEGQWSSCIFQNEKGDEDGMDGGGKNTVIFSINIKAIWEDLLRMTQSGALLMFAVRQNRLS